MERGEEPIYGMEKILGRVSMRKEENGKAGRGKKTGNEEDQKVWEA